jgi:hypothetical protein
MNWEQDIAIEDRLFKRDIKFLSDMNDKILERVIKEVKRLDSDSVTTIDEKSLGELSDY